MRERLSTGALPSLLIAAVMVSLAAARPALAAPHVQVAGGTLSIPGSDDAGVSALMSADTFNGVANILGQPPGLSTAFPWFAYGPRAVWYGTAPVPGPGCQPRPDAGGEIMCPGVSRIEIALAGGDDFLSVTSSGAPVRVDGGAGDDGLRLDTSDTGGTLDGGPGNDSLRAEGPATLHGGPGDDYISLESSDAVADCGPGDDVVTDDLHYVGGPATVDEATCGPVLRPAPPHGLPTPPLPGELRGIAPIEPRDGRVKLQAFRPSEAGRGTLQLKQARSVTELGYPRPGTDWSACSERRAFRMRAGRVLRTTLTLVPRLARRARRLEPPGRRFSRKSMIPCSLHVSGVDDDGERFHREDFSLVLYNPR